MQCCPGNFLMHSWHKLCSVDATKLNWFGENSLVLQSTITACADTKNGQCNSIYPHSVIPAHIFNKLTAFLFLMENFLHFPHLTLHQMCRIQNACLKAALSGLRQFLATESPLIMMKNAFYFT